MYLSIFNIKAQYKGHFSACDESQTWCVNDGWDYGFLWTAGSATAADLYVVLSSHTQQE